MTLSRGCHSDKARFVYNRRLDFAFREALLYAKPASHVKLMGPQARITQCEACDLPGTLLDIYQFVPAQREQDSLQFPYLIDNLRYDV
jgi:hypothetical protein